MTELGQGKLVFSPVSGQFGDDYASFTFRVNDGTADSADAYTMTVDVDPDPDYGVLISNLCQVFPIGRHRAATRPSHGHRAFTPQTVVPPSTSCAPSASGLELRLGTRPTLTLAVYDSNADGTPKDLVHTLTTPWPSPADIPGSDTSYPTVWFPAPTGAELDGDTDYHVAIQTPGGDGSNSFQVAIIGADAQTGAPRWTLEDGYRVNGTISPNSLMIAVRGRGLGASFGSGTYTATEGGAGAEVTVTLIPLPETAVEIPLTVTSRDGGASAADHSEIPASLSFAAGVGSRTFTVTATDDGVDAEGKSITIGFGDLPEGYSAGTPGAATVRLVDNDETVYFDASVYTATEGGTAATVTATLSTAPPTPIQVPLTVTRKGDTGVDDYSGVPATLTFAAMQTSATFTVTATDDSVDDDGESIVIALGDPPAPYVRGSVPETTVALHDNDVPLARNGEFLNDHRRRLQPHGRRLPVRRHGRGPDGEREDRLAAGQGHADARR